MRQEKNLPTNFLWVTSEIKTCMIFRVILLPRPTIKSPMQAISIFELILISEKPAVIKIKHNSKAFLRLLLSEYEIKKGIPNKAPID